MSGAARIRVAYGALARPVSLERFGPHVEAKLARKPLVVGEATRRIARVAWCTGAAQNYFEAAIAVGVDA